MGKEVRVPADWRDFWAQCFSYIQKNNLPLFDSLFFLVTIPPLIHLQDRELRKALAKRVRQLKKRIPPGENGLAMAAMLTLLYAFKSFASGRKYTPLEEEILRKLHWHISKTLAKVEEEDCSFADALEKGSEENLLSTEISVRSCFFYRAVLSNSMVEEVKELIKKSQEEEWKGAGLKGPQPASILFRGFLGGDEIREFIEEKIKRYAGKVTLEDIIEQYGLQETLGERVPSRLVALLRFCFGLEVSFIHHEAEKRELVEELARKTEEFEASLEKLLEEKDQLREEIERLRRALQQQTAPRREKVYVDKSDAIEALRQSYEAQLGRLKEELEFWRQLAKEKIEAKKEEEIKPFREKKKIAYYGKLTPQLQGEFAKYNIEAVEYSAVSPQDARPQHPVVFNTSEASHKVFYRLKSWGVNIVAFVSGRRAEQIARTVAAALHNINKGGENGKQAY